MSLRLIRAIESPRFDRSAIASRFPGYTLIGARSGWFYPVEQTRCVLIATAWPSLVKIVRSHLEGNAVPLPADLNATMEDWWCRNVDGTDCAEPPDPAAMARAMSLQTRAARFLRTAIAWMMGGGGLVAQEEAERRAAICAGCPLNLDIRCSGGCLFVSLLNRAMQMFSTRTTANDHKLQSCGACGCALRAAIHLPLSAMQYPELDGAWAEGCWHKAE